METAILPPIHAATGIAVLVIAIVQMILPKGNRLHRVIGRIYLGVWGVLLITGAILGSWMITALGLLGFYCVWTAFRFARSKEQPWPILDKGFVILGNLTSLALIGYAIYLLSQSAFTFGLVFLTFGLLFLFVTYPDLRQQIQGIAVDKRFGTPTYWLIEHLSRMLISLIAAVTAFSALQDVFGITLLNWLVPTGLGFLVVMLTQRRYT